jgi:protein-tyrosine phosphatase
MEGFIDIHSHIIPDLDDGSPNMDQTVNMLRIAYRDGIRSIIVTPHNQRGKYRITNNQIKYHMNELQEYIDSSSLDITLHMGSEIYYSYDTIQLLKENQLLTLAGSKYVLIEFPPTSEYPYIKNGLTELCAAGYFPILAHAERYKNITCDVERFYELICMGVYIQVNAMTITGDNGRPQQIIVNELLKRDYVHFIATDCHSDGIRAPRLFECVDTIRRKYGEAYVDRFLIENPGKVLNKEYDIKVHKKIKWSE